MNAQRCVDVGAIPADIPARAGDGETGLLAPSDLGAIVGGAGNAARSFAMNRGILSPSLPGAPDAGGYDPPVLLSPLDSRVIQDREGAALAAVTLPLYRSAAPAALRVAGPVAVAPAPALRVVQPPAAVIPAEPQRQGPAAAPEPEWVAAPPVGAPDRVMATPAREADAGSPQTAAEAGPPRALFRREALAAHDSTELDFEPLTNPRAGAWIVLSALVSLVGLLFVGAALLSVEVTVKAPGALRAPNGLRSVESVLAGAVTDVLARAGDEVAAQQVVMRLEDTKLKAALTLRDRELELLRQDTVEAEQADRTTLRSATRALQQQKAAVRRRLQIANQQLRQRKVHHAHLEELVRHGAASSADEMQVNESVQSGLQAVAELGSQLAQLELLLADRMREWQARDLERRAALGRASAAVEEAKSLLELVDIRSPAAGRIESILATPGSVVQAGEVMAQVVPKDAPRSIVAFLPSREVAFVRVGTDANVEVESLPINEFGMARARVTRISTDIAKPEEFQAAFGEVLPGSFVRVELSLSNDATHDQMAPHLRSGERVLVRLHRRERRILGLLFEFVRKWLGH